MANNWSTYTYIIAISFVICNCNKLQQVPLKSVILNTSNINQDGAQIVAASPSEVTISNNQFNIISNNDNTWHLILDLDNSWGFHPIIPSSLSITINGGDNGTWNEDLIIGFTVTNTEYFVTRIYTLIISNQDATTLIRMIHNHFYLVI